jgi:hypothetical protein
LSPPRSGRGTSSARPAPRAGGRPGVFVQTPKSDIYVVMLSIALGSIFMGCLLLILLLNRYEFQIKAAALETKPRPAIAYSTDRAIGIDRFLQRA